MSNSAIEMHVSRHGRAGAHHANPSRTISLDEALDALGEADRRGSKGAGDVRLTMGGEPTFVSIDDFQSSEWNTAAVGAHQTVLRRYPDPAAARRASRQTACCITARASGIRGKVCRAGRLRLYWRKRRQADLEEPRDERARRPYAHGGAAGRAAVSAQHGSMTARLKAREISERHGHVPGPAGLERAAGLRGCRVQWIAEGSRSAGSMSMCDRSEAGRCRRRAPGWSAPLSSGLWQPSERLCAAGSGLE